MTPYIIGASDLAFILLFFFIMVGSGLQKQERIEMPYKRSANAVDKITEAPFRIEIYDKGTNSDSSRMAIIFDRATPPDTLYILVDNNSLAQPEAYEMISERLAGFIQQKEVAVDSMRIDIFSSAYSYYGLIAIAIAACNQLEYPCNLVYRTKAS